MRAHQLLLASVGLAALQVCTAHAQTADVQTAEQPATTAIAAATPADEIPEVQVYGVGETRQVQTLSAKDLKDFAPGTSPLKALAELPGVTYTSSDPFATDEWENRLSVRGFQQNQMGWTLDDIPLGDQDFVVYNGLTITRAISSENISRLSVSQGAGAIDTASSSNLGGTIQFYSQDPHDKAGATGSQTFGTNDTYHTFVRLDTGKLDTGTKLYVSYARTDAGKWKGEGSNRTDQVNTKVIQDTSIGKFSAYFDWSSWVELDEQDLSLNIYNTLGRNVDNYYPDYKAAYNAAIATQQTFSGTFGGPPGPYPAFNASLFTHGEALTNDPWDTSYYMGSVLREDYLGGLAYNTDLTDSLHWKTTLYGHNDHTDSNWVNPFQASPNGAPLSQRATYYDIQRYGFVTAWTYDIGNHSLNAGVWYENNTAKQARRYYQEPLLGQGDPISPYDEPDASLAFVPGTIGTGSSAWDYKWTTNTAKFHLQDTWQVIDSVTLNAGFKSLSVATDGGETHNNGLAHGSLSAARGLLPQFGANWQITPDNEVFADVAKNMRSFELAGWGGGASPWAGSQIAFKFLQPNIKPETDWSYEVGYRFKVGDIFEGLATAYLTNFNDRLFAISSGPLIAAASTILQNVGGVTSRGLEASGTFHLMPHVSWYNSGDFNRTTFDSDYLDGTTIRNVEGKTEPGIPKFQYKTVLGYDDGEYAIHLDGNWMSQRYYTYYNDVALPDQFVFNMGGSYTFGNYDVLSDIKISANIYNLFDKNYIGTMGEEGFAIDKSGADGPLGSFPKQSLLAGAARSAYVTVSAKF